MLINKEKKDINIIINAEQKFQTNLGWDENILQFEEEILSDIINPIYNYDVIRYNHSPYSGISNNVNHLVSDIWYKFYFIDSNNTYNNGLDYNNIGITPKENFKLLEQTTNSFFKLEYFLVPSNELPNKQNRKFVFSKYFTIPNGELIEYTVINKKIFIPVFHGNEYKNKEIINLYWFQDKTVLNETNYDINNLYFTAKFFNSKDGSIIDFTNKPTTNNIIEELDLYYKIELIDNYKYKVINNNNRVGLSYVNSINFYEKK